MEYIIGIALPPVIDYVNRNVHNDEEKVWMTIITCFLVACIFDWNLIVTGNLKDTTEILKLAAILIAEATTVYKLFWQNNSIRPLLPLNGISKPVEVQG